VIQLALFVYRLFRSESRLCHLKKWTTLAENWWTNYGRELTLQVVPSCAHSALSPTSRSPTSGLKSKLPFPFREGEGG
jgi:hypothetical protein